MFSVIANNYAKEGCLDEFIANMKELVEETNKYDAGCIKSAMYRDLANPLIITVMEEWESQEAIDNHLSSKHFLDTVAKLMPYFVKPTDVRQFEKLF